MTAINNRVIDSRNKEKFFVDDHFLDHFSVIVGPTATILYLWLCRFADKDGKCFPGQETLADKMGLDARTVRRNLDALERHNIITIVRSGKTRTNRYHLLDKKEWVKEPKVTGQECPVTPEVSGHESPVTDRTEMSDQTQSDRTPVSGVIGHRCPVNEDTIMSDHSKGSRVRVPVQGVTDTNVSVQDQPTIVNPVNELFAILLEINQTLNFANKTERSAAQRIIDRLGEEKALSAARAAVMASKSNDQFAPSITTPLELEKKMGKLVRFFNQKQLDQTRSAAYSVTV